MQEAILWTTTVRTGLLSYRTIKWGFVGRTNLIARSYEAKLIAANLKLAGPIVPTFCRTRPRCELRRRPLKMVEPIAPPASG